MKTKKKMSITIDADIFMAVEKAATSCNMAKKPFGAGGFQLVVQKKNRRIDGQRIC